MVQLEVDIRALVIDMIDRDGGSSTNDLSEIAYRAAKNGHKDIVIAMIRRGADEWNWIEEYAERYGHMDIVKYINDIRG